MTIKKLAFTVCMRDRYRWALRSAQHGEADYTMGQRLTDARLQACIGTSTVNSRTYMAPGADSRAVRL